MDSVVAIVMFGLFCVVAVLILSAFMDLVEIHRDQERR
jgi:hypothetical protein